MLDLFWVESLLTDTICGDEVMLTRYIVRFCAELIKGLCLAWSARCIDSLCSCFASRETE